jgi:quercetin dioxygenase-like cupin family protein
MFKIINVKDQGIVESGPDELYRYRAFIGEHQIATTPYASYWQINRDFVSATTGTGYVIESDTLCVEILGYTPEDRTSTYARGTDLPYINGCSTKQLIPPVRPGDPTLQMLYIPAGTSEQSHHIHATARIVYVAKGSGVSIVGTPGKSTKYKLNEGDVIILPKMVPHHFETKKQDLVVLPIHVFSSVGSAEFDHPMFNGTHKV